MPQLDVEKTAIAFIKGTGETVKEIVSIGVSSDDITVVVFINESDEKRIAEISESGAVEIFEYVD